MARLVSLLVVLVFLLVLLGHEIPPTHLPGVLAPTTWASCGTIYNVSKARVVATLWGKLVLSLVQTVSIAPVHTMGNGDMTELFWGD